MCSRPKYTAPPAPLPPPQAAKLPDSAVDTRRGRGQAPRGAMSAVGSTLLTGPAGVDNSTLNIGRATLLGG
jgi:hypothetical protein